MRGLRSWYEGVSFPLLWKALVGEVFYGKCVMLDGGFGLGFERFVLSCGMFGFCSGDMFWAFLDLEGKLSC